MDRIQTPVTTTITVPLPTPERLADAYDCYGSYWGSEPASSARTAITTAHANGTPVDEWHVTDRAGHPLHIARITDDILVIPGTTADLAVAA
ncbi:hypothetical protein PUR49_05405 [Streptomyces sp. BE147]|uniref:hypothetical protein n=1 Tax=Streptomyces sp. BE147 TaxID=3002524 RepID=UPI002E7917DA|nr:hypothetical protein [Streptomyces sp. BE147]MEE1735951.1 hypothetical protein [Streptomyces sp. BE147]